MWTVLIAAVTFAQAGAPKDVPSGHWAHAAVDQLFRAGILQGYKSDPQPLRLKALAPEQDWITTMATEWKQSGLLVGYPDWGHGRSNSGYEQAVQIHAVWANVTALLKDAKTAGTDRVTIVGVFDNLARAISMRAPELTKLGADPKAMVNELERLRCAQFGWVTFRG